MYMKDLTEDIKIRMSKKDSDFIGKLAEERGVSKGEVIRSIIGEYRRSLETVNVLKEAMKLVQERGALESGNIKADIDDKL